jgi:hypothetical protein
MLAAYVPIAIAASAVCASYRVRRCLHGDGKADVDVTDQISDSTALRVEEPTASEHLNNDLDCEDDNSGLWPHHLDEWPHTRYVLCDKLPPLQEEGETESDVDESGASEASDDNSESKDEFVCCDSKIDSAMVHSSLGAAPLDEQLAKVLKCEADLNAALEHVRARASRLKRYLGHVVEQQPMAIPIQTEATCTCSDETRGERASAPPLLDVGRLTSPTSPLGWRLNPGDARLCQMDWLDREMRRDQELALEEGPRTHDYEKAAEAELPYGGIPGAELPYGGIPGGHLHLCLQTIASRPSRPLRMTDDLKVSKVPKTPSKVPETPALESIISSRKTFEACRNLFGAHRPAPGPASTDSSVTDGAAALLWSKAELWEAEAEPYVRSSPTSIMSTHAILEAALATPIQMEAIMSTHAILEAALATPIHMEAIRACPCHETVEAASAAPVDVPKAAIAKETAPALKVRGSAWACAFTCMGLGNDQDLAVCVPDEKPRNNAC